MSLFTTLPAASAAKAPNAQNGPARRLQRACACAGKGDCDACTKKKLQRRAQDAAQPAVPASALAGFERGGEPLAGAWRQRVEPLFGTSFAAVRVHDDASSHAAARSLNAHAFTVGQHLHFGAGRLNPHSRDGLHLLAHELAHTVQQRGATPLPATDSIDIDGANAPLERDADAHADAIVAGRPTRVRAGSAGMGVAARLQREAGGAVESDRKNGDGTGMLISRTLEERDCKETPEKRSTPRDRIFKWDREANALKLDYSLCYGSVRLTAESSIDYTRVLESGKTLLDTLQNNPAAGADIKGLAETAIDDAKISSQGEVAITVDGILRAAVGAESTAGAGEQNLKVKGTLKITPNGVSFVLTGFVDVQRTPELKAEQYSLNLKVGTRWFSVDLGYQVDDKRPVGGAATNQGTLKIGAEIPLPNIGPLKNVTIKPGVSIDQPGGTDQKVTPGLTFGGSFGGPDKTERVNCYHCECPPPLPKYRCTPYGSKKVIDRKGDDTQLSLAYQYDSNTPADEAAFKARVASIGSMVAQDYAVQSVRGYASPEGKVDYNEALATRRAQHAHGEIAKQLPAGAAPLPAAEGVGELLGESGKRPGSEAANNELTTELKGRLEALGPDERLNLLEVDATVRADPVQRQKALDDIDAFVTGKDAKGKALAGRARWEKVFPFMRRVDVQLHLSEKSHPERDPKPDEAGACEAADRALVDSEHPIPPDKRLPAKKCRE